MINSLDVKVYRWTSQGTTGLLSTNTCAFMRWTLAEHVDKFGNLDAFINSIESDKYWMPEEVVKSREQILEVATAKWLDCYPNFKEDAEFRRSNG